MINSRCLVALILLCILLPDIVVALKSALKPLALKFIMQFKICMEIYLVLVLTDVLVGFLSI